MGKRFFLALIGAAAALMMASCTDDSKIAPEGVSLDRTSITMHAGDKDSLIATITPSDAHNQRVRWTSSEPTVVAVTRKGAIEALAVGKATITVTSVIGKYTATCEVVVDPIAVTGISLDKTSHAMNVGETVTLTATVTPANASDPSYTWASSNEEVATVANGVVTGVDEGEATITATTKDGNKVASCKVTVTLKVPTEAETLDLWKDDSKGKIAVLGGSEKKTVDFITYNGDNVVRWSENTTGKPRTATIEFSTGSKVTITQISANDFKGNWTLYSQLFDPNKTLGKGNTQAYTVTVAFGEPLAGVSLKDGEKTHTNNIGIKGLYLESVLDATAEIDYQNKKVSFGLFFDRRSAQKANASTYCAYLPECSGGYWKDYLFAPGDKAFSDSNYEWLWFDVSSDFNTMKYQYFGAGQKTSNGKYYICGISIVKATSADASTLGSKYDVIYQANYKKDNNESMYFKRSE
ncbi:MAG TPA: hypothetical protein DD383_04950 [Rikenellaceae bacterium]|nr:hypothetical protein [Rikenellaceae bacterium]